VLLFIIFIWEAEVDTERGRITFFLIVILTTHKMHYQHHTAASTEAVIVLPDWCQAVIRNNGD